MDSITQAALGAAVGYACAGHALGKKALLWGAMLGTLPDADIFIPYDDPVKSFTYHRSFTHSFIIHACITPFFGEIIRRIQRHTLVSRTRIYAFVFLVLITHALLDCFTSYGTQIWWPLSTAPVAWASISIVDPAYTFILIIGTIVASFKTQKSNAMRYIGGALFISSVYLTWTLFAQMVMRENIRQAFLSSKVSIERMFVSPTLFNSLLWQYVVIDGDDYYTGFRSVFDPPNHEWTIQAKPRNIVLLNTLDNGFDVQRLIWFSKNFYKAEKNGDLVIFTDLRMGTHPNYVFNYAVGTITKHGIKPLAKSKYFRSGLRKYRLLQLVKRITNPRVEL